MEMITGHTMPAENTSKSPLFELMTKYRHAVQARDTFVIRKMHLDYPQHTHMFQACFKAVNRRLRFEKRYANLGPTP